VPEMTSHSVAIEVYLASTIIRGMLMTKHERLSDHVLMRAGDEVFSVHNSKVEDLNGQPLSFGGAEYVIHMDEVLFIADSNGEPGPERSNLDHTQIAKEPKNVVMLVGPFWVRGQVHLLPGATVQNLLTVKSRFIPVTEATLLGRPEAKPCTFLVNRTKIACVAATD